MRFRRFFFVSRFFLLDLLQLQSFYISDLLDGEADDDGSDSESAGTCAFPFFFDESVGCVADSAGRVNESVGCVSGVGSGVFVPTVIDSIGDTVPLVTFVPKGVDSKGGQIIEVFWRPKS